MVQQGRRRLTADMIGSPTNFVHFDGPSFAQTPTVDLDEARCRVMFDRLQKTPSKKSRSLANRFMFRSDSPPGECCFPASLLLRPSSPRDSSMSTVFSLRSGRGSSPSTHRQIEISEPFDFVHVRHVSLDGVNLRPTGGTTGVNSRHRLSSEVAVL